MPSRHSFCTMRAVASWLFMFDMAMFEFAVTAAAPQPVDGRTCLLSLNQSTDAESTVCM